MITELYKFTEVKRDMGTETVISTTTYTSQKRSVTYDSLTYTPVAMSRSDNESKSAVSTSNMKVYFSLDNAFADSWFNNDDSILKFELIEKEDTTYSIIWKGRLVNVEISGNNSVLNFESNFSSLRNYGLNRVYQRTCPHALFSTACGADKDDYRTFGTIGAVSGITLTVLALSIFDDHYFTYGTIVDGAGNSRMITSQIGDQIKISRYCPTFTASTSVTLYLGCSKTREICNSKFANVKNFGGFPYMPVDDMFDRILVV